MTKSPEAIKKMSGKNLILPPLYLGEVAITDQYVSSKQEYFLVEFPAELNDQVREIARAGGINFDLIGEERRGRHYSGDSSKSSIMIQHRDVDFLVTSPDRSWLAPAGKIADYIRKLRQSQIIAPCVLGKVGKFLKLAICESLFPGVPISSRIIQDCESLWSLGRWRKPPLKDLAVWEQLTAREMIYSPVLTSPNLRENPEVQTITVVDPEKSRVPSLPLTFHYEFEQSSPQSGRSTVCPAIFPPPLVVAEPREIRLFRKEKIPGARFLVRDINEKPIPRPRREIRPLRITSQPEKL